MVKINNPFLTTEAMGTTEAMEMAKAMKVAEITKPTIPVFWGLNHTKKAAKNMNLDTYRSKFFRSKRIRVLKATAI